MFKLNIDSLGLLVRLNKLKTRFPLIGSFESDIKLMSALGLPHNDLLVKSN